MSTQNRLNMVTNQEPGLRGGRESSRTEPRAKNEGDDGAVTADALFDAIRFQVLVVHAPAGRPQPGQLAALQSFDDGVDILAWSRPERGSQPGACVRIQFSADLPVQKQPSAVA